MWYAVVCTYIFLAIKKRFQTANTTHCFCGIAQLVVFFVVILFQTTEAIRTVFLSVCSRYLRGWNVVNHRIIVPFDVKGGKGGGNDSFRKTMDTRNLFRILEVRCNVFYLFVRFNEEHRLEVIKYVKNKINVLHSNRSIW